MNATRSAPLSGRHSRRGFTLLELVLASALGVAIVFASYSLLSSMTKAGAKAQQRNFGTGELARAHQAFRKAFSTLVVHSNIPRSNPRPAAAKPGEQNTPPTAAAANNVNPGNDPNRPQDMLPARVLLEQDTSFASALPVFAPTLPATGLRGASAGGNAGAGAVGGGSEVAPLAVNAQRLELVVSEPPILAGIDGTPLPGEREEWLSKTRGAFELKPSASGRGVDLVWVVYPLALEEPPPSTNTANPLANAGAKVDGAPAGSGEAPDVPLPINTEPKVAQATLVIARELERCNFRLVRSTEGGRLEPLTEARIVSEDELPAYLELDIASVHGQTGTWMFEVGWTVDTNKNRANGRSAVDTVRGRGDGKGGGTGSGRSGSGSGAGSGSKGGTSGGSKDPSGGGKGE